MIVESSFPNIVGSIATAALIGVALRWLLSARGAELPKSHDGTAVYGIKWQFRTLGIVTAVFAVVLAIWSWYDLHRADGVMIAFLAIFLPGGLWLAIGTVTITQDGIKKDVFWRSRSFRWIDITEILLHKKHGGAIEVRAGKRKLIIDSRFNAYEHLLNEIQARTRLHITAE